MKNAKKNNMDEDLLLLKPYLRFQIGDIVCLKGDLFQSVPMTITNTFSDDIHDYICEWLTSQKTMEKGHYKDAALCPYIVNEE